MIPMAKFLFTYHGGSMAETPEAQEAAMAAWGGWFGALGSAVVDHGNPCGASATVTADGSVVDGGGANPATGYTTVEADDLAAATVLVKGCPVLASGGSVEVSELIPVM